MILSPASLLVPSGGLIVPTAFGWAPANVQPRQTRRCWRCGRRIIARAAKRFVSSALALFMAAPPAGGLSSTATFAGCSTCCGCASFQCSPEDDVTVTVAFGTPGYCCQRSIGAGGPADPSTSAKGDPGGGSAAISLSYDENDPYDSLENPCIWHKDFTYYSIPPFYIRYYSDKAGGAHCGAGDLDELATFDAIGCEVWFSRGCDDDGPNWSLLVNASVPTLGGITLSGSGSGWLPDSPLTGTFRYSPCAGVSGEATVTVGVA